MKRNLLAIPALAAIAALLQGACGRAVGGTASEGPTTGFHPTGATWLDPSSPSFHGRQVSQSCFACHDATTSCSQCHFGSSGSRVPAGASWTHGTTPHDFPESEAVCNKCHELMRGFEQGPGTCHDCHLGVAVHPTGQAWLDKKSPTFHGNRAQDNLASCAPCHGGDYQGGASGVSCFTCHFGTDGRRTPPGSGWNHGTVPHGDLAPHGSVCNLCHQVNRIYGNAPGSCHDCHGDGDEEGGGGDGGDGGDGATSD